MIVVSLKSLRKQWLTQSMKKYMKAFKHLKQGDLIYYYHGGIAWSAPRLIIYPYYKHDGEKIMCGERGNMSFVVSYDNNYYNHKKDKQKCVEYNLNCNFIQIACNSILATSLNVLKQAILKKKLRPVGKIIYKLKNNRFYELPLKDLSYLVNIRNINDIKIAKKTQILKPTSYW